MLEKFTVYFITDSKYGKHEELAKKALEGGVRAIQFREKRMTSKEMYKIAKKLRKITLEYDSILVINDRVDIAIASDADGVHVGQSDLPYEVISDIFDGYIGVTAKSVEEAILAEKYADYLGVGPIFETKTKKDAGHPIGLAGLKKIAESVNIPVIAIGGIKKGLVKDVLEAGAFGIAVISEIAASGDVTRAAKELVDIVKKFK